jgi:hypothetical protein
LTTEQGDPERVAEALSRTVRDLFGPERLEPNAENIASLARSIARVRRLTATEFPWLPRPEDAR